MKERTDDEILARIEVRKEEDFFGFETPDLIACLSWEKGKPFYNDEYVAKDRESIIERMLEYMPFAWEKANNCRGISAGRSMHHYMAWTWLAGDDFGDLCDYEYYGKDNLVRLCDHYGWDSGQWDDGIRSNTEY